MILVFAGVNVSVGCVCDAEAVRPSPERSSAVPDSVQSWSVADLARMLVQVREQGCDLRRSLLGTTFTANRRAVAVADAT